MKDPTLFQLTSDLQERNDLGMYDCGKRIQTLHHHYGPEINNYFLFVLVNEGNASFYHKSGVIQLKEHDLLVMCPKEKIYYVAHTPWSIQWVGLYGQTVEKYMKLLSIDGDHPIVKIKEYYELESILDQLYGLLKERSEDSKCRQIALIYQFFSLLLRNSSQKTEVNLAKSAKRILDYNFNKDMTVKELASTLYLSSEHFTRQFTDQYGVSPKEYLIEKRIEAAKKLLRETTASILEISHSVGYSDPLYFSRIFKKKAGVSPSAYRKQID